MSLIRRHPTGPKTIDINGNKFYLAADAANLLGFSKSKLIKGLKSKRYSFQIVTLEDFPNAPIYVSVRDVEVFIRKRNQILQARMGANNFH